jgi:transposase
MRQNHVAGERMFVDYAGTTLAVIDASTGEARWAQLFVAVLGASNYTYAEATWTQGLSDWIGAHTRAFAFVVGVPAMVVSDNLRSGITKACFYEPQVNRTYSEMAAHYGTAIIPARPYRARDKAKVEVAVQIATRFIIAKLRNRHFFALSALNGAVAELVEQINNRVSRHLGASRRALFEELERSALKQLPAEPYVFAEWKQCRVGLDYHVEIEKHYYSVPHQLLREKVWARITARASGLLRTCAHRRTASIRRCASIYRRVISAMPTGRRSASAGRPVPSAATPRHWSRSSCGSARILSKASAPASASYGSPRAMGVNGSKPPAAAPSRSGRAPTARSIRFSKTISIADGL